MKRYSNMDLTDKTKVVRGSQGWDETTGAVSFPIYQSATFRHPSLGETTGWDYSRQGNPTRQELEDTLASLEGGIKGFAFSTGMAAVCSLFELFTVGDELIFCEDLYGGTYRYATIFAQKHGLITHFVDSRDIQKVKELINPKVKLLFIETPSNPIMRISDIQGLSELCKQNNMLFAVDNTFLTPLKQKPLKLGADIVVHSGSKYISGHNDTLAGFVVVKDPSLGDELSLIAKSSGAVLSPFDCWLVLRGLKTLDVRIERQEKNALALVEFLTNHPKVQQVYYPGLKSHSGFELQSRQASGFGGMISFQVESKELAANILKKVQLILFAESLGGTESLITYPLVQTHASIPQEILDRLGVNDKLLRLSVGIESIEDLIKDLTQALQ